MLTYPDNQRRGALLTKGGVMFFTIERYPLLYQGAVVLSPVENKHFKRAVYVKEYRYKNDHIQGEQKGCDETQPA